MSVNEEEFKLNWQELKFLIDLAQKYIFWEIDQVSGIKLDEVPYIKKMNDEFNEIKKKFNFDEKVNQWKQDQERIKKQEKNTNLSENQDKIKNNILELSKKFNRLFISELVEEIQESDSAIVNVIKEMIEKGEINAKFFESTKSLVFEK